MDVITAERRSRVMSRIRGKDTRPELAVRRLVHGLGYRFRLHRRDLPGVPDLAFIARRKVIFVHGCFWHQHPGCEFAYKPKSNSAFWRRKFAANTKRDMHVLAKLAIWGWDALVIWECELSDPKSLKQRMMSHLEGGE
jgi:DNA mismatch endonuclease, patch repair protein